MVTVIITGILISRVVFPSLAVQGGHSIRGIHSFSADVTLALVGLHVGVHWQWVMSICKKAFKSKEGKLRKGVIASVVLSIALLAGGIQWYSAATSSNIADFVPKQVQQSRQSSYNGNTGLTTSTVQGPPSGDFREGKFHGKNGHGGSSNPFRDVLNYFAIWAAIIIPTYYFEKRNLTNKRKSRNLNLQN